MNDKRIWNHPKGVVVACDGTKLRDILYDKGYTFKGAANELKVGTGTFSRVYNLDRISSTVVALLEQFMDIRPSDYNVHMVENLSWGEWGHTKKDYSNCPVENKRNYIKPKDKISIKIDIDRDILKELIKEAVREVFDEI